MACGLCVFVCVPVCACVCLCVLICPMRSRLPYCQPFVSLEKGDPRWISSTNVKACQHCSAKFTMLLRKHHCRACGSCLCNNCSPYKRTKHMERMCRRCNALERGTVFDVISPAEGDFIIDAAYQGDLLEVGTCIVLYCIVLFIVLCTITLYCMYSPSLMSLRTLWPLSMAIRL
jgi:hypothetical protein